MSVGSISHRSTSFLSKTPGRLSFANRNTRFSPLLVHMVSGPDRTRCRLSGLRIVAILSQFLSSVCSAVRWSGDDMMIIHGDTRVQHIQNLHYSKVGTVIPIILMCGGSGFMCLVENLT